MADLAIILVSWNVRSLIVDALRTLFEDITRSGLQCLVYVVDNASSDGTVESIRDQFPQVNLLPQTQNLGFAAGNNVALRALGFDDQPITLAASNSTTPAAVFLLNPDTLVQPGALRTLYDALCTLPRAGVVGAQLEYGDGSFQHGAFGFPGLMQLIIDLGLFPIPGRLYVSRLNGRYSRKFYAQNKPFPVDHTLGATMMLRREVIEQTGLFDEQFYMYCEEVDWSIRIRKAGWEIYAVPEAKITHLEGKSASQIRPQSVINLWTSRLRLYQKHYSGIKLTLAKFLVRLGMRRKLREIMGDSVLPIEQREAIVTAYQQVMALYR